MSIQISPPNTPSTLTELLMECHHRIRKFTQLAQTIATTIDAPTEQIQDACAQCQRYFGTALPLHVQDEEESLLPRLRGRDPALDHALDTMHAQHKAHTHPLADFLAALQSVKDAPTDPKARQTLAPLADHLAAEFEAHLQLEEAHIFPALDQHLTAEDQAQIIKELRARRDLA